MRSIHKYFNVAKKAAKLGSSKDASKKYKIGAVGIRKDGIIVTSSNISTKHPNKLAHAEARLVKKLDMGAVVYIVRIDSNGCFKLARPCSACFRKLYNNGVLKCFYTINNKEYGVIKF